MKLLREQVLHIAELAKLDLSEEEIGLFTEQLSDILAYFEHLNTLDTSDLPPTAQAIYQRNVMRPDQVIASLAVDEALANAPERKGQHFKVNSILD